MFILRLLGAHLIPESPHFPQVLCGVNKCWSEDVPALYGEDVEVGGAEGQGIVLCGMETDGPGGAVKGLQPLFSKVEDS